LVSVILILVRRCCSPRPPIHQSALKLVDHNPIHRSQSKTLLLGRDVSISGSPKRDSDDFDQENMLSETAAPTTGGQPTRALLPPPPSPPALPRIRIPLVLIGDAQSKRAALEYMLRSTSTLSPTLPSNHAVLLTDIDFSDTLGVTIINADDDRIHSTGLHQLLWSAKASVFVVACDIPNDDPAHFNRMKNYMKVIRSQTPADVTPSLLLLATNCSSTTVDDWMFEVGREFSDSLSFVPPDTTLLMLSPDLLVHLQRKCESVISKFIAPSQEIELQNALDVLDS
jgi:hypothetical protein